VRNPTSDYEGPWKAAIEEYLPDFFALCFPVAYADIDWSRGYAFLDSELQQLMRDAETGVLRVDRLVKLLQKNGENLWVLVHIELQSQMDPDLPLRMALYNHRLYDRYRQDVVSLAVLADTNRRWRPARFRRGLWDCYDDFSYPVVKLADWRAQRPVLEASDNPFATVILAHLSAQDTRRSVAGRQVAKLALVRRLYERGYSRERILSLFRFIDWLLALPQAAEDQVWDDITKLEEGHKMTYITSVERRGIEKGRQEEARRALRRVLERRFGAAASDVVERLEGVRDVAKLEALLDQAITAASPDEIRALLV
jgi:hypothetical protein